jgi:drug/metabolite transporter (DMT)-like permease
LTGMFRIDKQTEAQISLLMITLLWGTSFVVVKDSLDYASPLWFLFLRFSLASAVLFLVYPRILLGLTRTSMYRSLVVGLFLYAGFALQTAGLVHTTPSKSAFITGCAVPLVPLLNFLVFRVSFRKPVAIGIVLAVGGLYLLTRPDLSAFNQGDVLTFGSAIAFAFQIIYIGRYASRMRYQDLAVFQIFWALVLSLPVALLVETPGLGYPLRVFASLAYLAVFCSALAFLVQSRAQRHVSAARTALIFAMEPVFAAFASLLLWNEVLLAREWLGGGLIVAGVIIGELPMLESRREHWARTDV